MRKSEKGMEKGGNRKDRQRRAAVIGGGASGCMAAIAAARAGAVVYLIEKNEKAGKKIYATGNGRCNLTNLTLDAACYHTASGDPGRRRILAMISRFSQSDLIRFFADLGVPVHDREGYVYPRTDQAETVVRAIEKCFRELDIHLMTDCRLERIEEEPAPGQPAGSPSAAGRFCLFCRHRVPDPSDAGSEAQMGSRSGKNKKKAKKPGTESRFREEPLVLSDFDAVILCTGGLAGPSFGCSGDGYDLAGRFSHHLVPPLPALTQLESDCPWLKRSAGVRCHAALELVGEDGCPLPGSREEGELQMTDYGISGIPVFQLSGMAARHLAAGKNLTARIDFLPEFSEKMFSMEIERRLSEDRDQVLSDLFLGLVHRRIIDLVLASEGLQAEMKARRLDDSGLTALFHRLRSFEMRITGTRSFDNAQTTSGGVPLEEVTDDLESIYRPGLYLAGEVLDVDGRCGGYNLQWAMTSGYLAGSAAGKPHG